MEKSYRDKLKIDFSRKGYLVVLEGVDGSGKTTLSRNIAAKIRNYRATYCSNKEIVKSKSFVEKCMVDVSSILWPKEDTTFDHLLPPHYWLYLQATWYSLLSEFVVIPKLEDGQVLIVDGWYYKFVAKLLLRGFTLDYLEIIFSHVVQPDIVILLEPDIEAIWDRKRDFRSHELGLHHDYLELGKGSFIDYQSKILRSFKTLAQEHKWIVVPLDAHASIEQNSDIILSHIKRQPFFADNPTDTDSKQE